MNMFLSDADSFQYRCESLHLRLELRVGLVQFGKIFAAADSLHAQCGFEGLLRRGQGFRLFGETGRDEGTAREADALPGSRRVVEEIGDEVAGRCDVVEIAKRVLLAGRPPIAYDLLSIDVGISPDLAPIRGAEHAIAVKPIGAFRNWGGL